MLCRHKCCGNTENAVTRQISNSRFNDSDQSCRCVKVSSNPYMCKMSQYPQKHDVYFPQHIPTYISVSIPFVLCDVKHNCAKCKMHFNSIVENFSNMLTNMSACVILLTWFGSRCSFQDGAGMYRYAFALRTRNYAMSSVVSYMYFGFDFRGLWSHKSGLSAIKFSASKVGFAQNTDNSIVFA